jgi:hypothetical protein
MDLVRSIRAKPIEQSAQITTLKPAVRMAGQWRQQGLAYRRLRKENSFCPRGDQDMHPPELQRGRAVSAQRSEQSFNRPTPPGMEAERQIGFS